MAAKAEDAGAACAAAGWDDGGEKYGDDAARATGPGRRTIKMMKDAHRLSKYKCPWPVAFIR